MVEADTLPGLVQIGETLRAARENRGIPLEQAATQLRCDLRVIESLEAGRFDDLGPPVFARGHLLRYAAWLGEPGEAMVEEWSQLAAAGTGAELMRGLHGPRGRDLRQVRRRLVVAAALLSGVAIASWALQNLPGRSAATSLPAVAVAPAPAATVEAPVKPPASEARAAPASAPAAVPQPAAPSPAPIVPAEARGQVRVRMAFAADSWLEIYDVRNRRLFFGLATVGAPVDVQGRAPLRVIVGNAPAATVELNGRRVEVPPEAMRGRRAAALRVNSDGRLVALPRA
jgi:cytoskeleton protein RodZ